MTTYLCTIPFATSFLATFKSKFASPLEEPSNFTFSPMIDVSAGRSSRRRRRGVAVCCSRLASERRAQAACCSGCRGHCVCIYFYCCFRTTKSDDEFSFFPLSPLQTTLFRPFLVCSLLLLVQKPSLSLSFDVRLLLLQKKKKKKKMKQTTTATVLADNVRL